MDPASFMLVLSLLAATGIVGYAAASTNDRTNRATRGSLGAVRAAATSGRVTGSTAFSRPPARTGSNSSLGADIGWFFKQLWAVVRTGWAGLRALPSGYRTGAAAATARRTERNSKREEKRKNKEGTTDLDADDDDEHGGEREVIVDLDGWLAGSTVLVDDGPVKAKTKVKTKRDRKQQVHDFVYGMDARIMAGLAMLTALVTRRPTDESVKSDDEPQESTDTEPSTDISPEDSGQNGDTVTATADIPTLEVPTEFPSPGAMEPPLEDLGILTAHIATALDSLTTGITDFVNGYAEAKFATAALTESIGAMVETIGTDGHVDIISFAETLPAISEAIEEAKTVGEVASQVDADGEVQGFREG